MKTKFIFVAGGTISGLGKGVTAASIGKLLKTNGNSVFVLKLDPYLNVDPGVMSPNEHGEVYVTNDGGETDLDLGHYERFIGVNLTKQSNYTSGKIYQKVLNKERNGEYGGKTVQIIPHVVDEIINIILNTAKLQNPDFMIVEIGGTVGDIESNPYIYALSKFINKNKNQSLLVYVTYVPFLAMSKEFKTKPTQVSLSTLRSFGLNSDILILRSQGNLKKEVVSKISSSSFVDEEKIICVPDIASIYKIPLFLKEQKILDTIFSHFRTAYSKDFEVNIKVWEKFTNKIDEKKEHSVSLALIGKYAGLEDAYLSIIESFKIASIHNGINLKYKLIDASKIDEITCEQVLLGYDGVAILPGFGERGFEGKITTANYTRDKKIPTFGICLGFQAMVVNQARRKGIKNANSAEFINGDSNKVAILDILPGKDKDKNLGGTLRLGTTPTIVKKETLAYKIYKHQIINERHRHRYEVDQKYVEFLQDEEFIFSGKSKVESLAEICELTNHPFYLGVQYHPEFNTTVLESHPLFNSFLNAIVKNKK